MAIWLLIILYEYTNGYSYFHTLCIGSGESGYQKAIAKQIRKEEIFARLFWFSSLMQYVIFWDEYESMSNVEILKMNDFILKIFLFYDATRAFSFFKEYQEICKSC